MLLGQFDLCRLPNCAVRVSGFGEEDAGVLRFDAVSQAVSSQLTYPDIPYHLLNVDTELHKTDLMTS
jgi:hypothetical protein